MATQGGLCDQSNRPQLSYVGPVFWASMLIAFAGCPQPHSAQTSPKLLQYIFEERSCALHSFLSWVQPVKTRCALVPPKWCTPTLKPTLHCKWTVYYNMIHIWSTSWKHGNTPLENIGGHVMPQIAENGRMGARTLHFNSNDSTNDGMGRDRGWWQALLVIGSDAVKKRIDIKVQTSFRLIWSSGLPRW